MCVRLCVCVEREMAGLQALVAIHVVCVDVHVHARVCVCVCGGALHLCTNESGALVVLSYR